MPPTKTSPSTAASSDVNSLFEKELNAVHEDVRRKAALATLRNMRPTNRVTVEQFMTSAQKHKDIWAVVSTLGIVDLAEALLGQKSSARSDAPAAGKRTRLSEDQKNELKAISLRLLEANRGGLSRTELASQIQSQGLKPSVIADAELAEKLRTPLAELLDESKLHTVGEKRLMKYFFGGRRK